MPLPESGQISAEDINEDIGNDPNVELDIDDVATNRYDLERPHGFDEFYGRHLSWPNRLQHPSIVACK